MAWLRVTLLAWLVILFGGPTLANESAPDLDARIESLRSRVFTMQLGDVIRQADALLTESIACCQATPTLATARILNSLTAYRDQRRDDAMQLAGLAAAMARPHPDDPAWQRVALLAEGALGFFHFQAGQTHVALPHLQAAYALAVKRYGPQDRETLTRLKNLALARFDLGRDEDALTLQRELVALSQKDTGLEFTEQLSREVNLIAFEAASGNWSRAEAAILTTLPVAEQRLGDDHLDVAILNFYKGYLALRQQGDSVTALAALDRALSVQRRLSGALAPNTIASRGERALAMARMGQHAMATTEAAATVADAIALGERDTSRGDSRTLLRALARQIDIAELTGDVAQAERSLSALVTRVERYRRRAAIEDQLERVRFGLWAPYYQRYAVRLLQRGERAAALAVADASRARLFIDERSIRVAPNVLSVQDQRALSSRSAALAVADAELARAELDATLSSRELVAAQEAYAMAWRAWFIQRQAVTRDAPADGSPTLAKWREMGEAWVARTPAHSAIVTWLETETVSFALLLTHGTIYSAPLPASSRKTTLQGYAAWAATPPGRALAPYWERQNGELELTVVRPPDALSKAPLDQAGWQRRMLDQWLPASLRRHLVRAKRVTLVLEGDLARVSPALWLAPSGLTEGFVVASSVSQATARLPQAPSPRRAAWVVTGDLTDLPGAGREALTLTARYRMTPLPASPLAAAELGSRLRDARWIHMALHGQFDHRRPLRSSLRITADRAVRASEVMQWQFAAAPVVILAACESAALKDAPGDSALGLPYALRLAGAGAVVATLWPVDDTATERFMSRFYRAVSRGESMVRALHLTQREFASGKAGPNYTAPFFWAGFVLYV
jgi:hypothetical protein